jgi:signal transduction histidine kinase
MLVALSSFGEESTPSSDLDRIMSRSDAGDWALAPWMRHARVCAPIAKVLVEVARSLFGPAGHVDEQLRRMIRRPAWGAMADRLSAGLGVSLVRAEFLAVLAREVARRTRWCPIERAFWHALTETSPLGRHLSLDDLEFLEEHEKCRVVANWCLDALADRGVRAADGRVLSASQASKGLDSVAHLLDPLALMAEAERVTVAAGVLDESSVRRLASLARLASYRQEAGWRESLFHVVQAADTDSALNACRRLLSDWLGDAWGLWMAGADDATGAGLWVATSDGCSSMSFQGTCSAFHDVLPTRYRLSRPLVSAEGQVVARVYSEESWPTMMEGWLDRLGASIGALRARCCAQDRQREKRVAQEYLAQRRFEQQSRFRQAIGEFSAGAGHEINNPLGAIAGHGRRLLKEETDPERRRSLQQIVQQVERIGRMIKDLQLIGGQYAIQREPIAVDDLLTSALGEAERRLHGGRRIVDSSRDSLYVVGDRVLLTRMLAELVVNGAEAAGPGGKVRLWAEPADGASSRVDIVICDSGPGLSPTVRERAFLPFYSGRDAGRGLGMGLPLAERIALDHGGELVIAFGKPTTVRVQLPAA